MNLKKRSLIFVTFFLSCLAIALLGASLGTKVGKLLLINGVGIVVADAGCGGGGSDSKALVGYMEDIRVRHIYVAK